MSRSFTSEVFDTETSGFGADDEIIEIGAVELEVRCNHLYSLDLVEIRLGLNPGSPNQSRKWKSFGCTMLRESQK